MVQHHRDQVIVEDVCQVAKVWFAGGDFGMDQLQRCLAWIKNVLQGTAIVIAGLQHSVNCP